MLCSGGARETKGPPIFAKNYKAKGLKKIPQPLNKVKTRLHSHSFSEQEKAYFHFTLSPPPFEHISGSTTALWPVTETEYIIHCVYTSKKRKY